MRQKSWWLALLVVGVAAFVSGRLTACVQGLLESEEKPQRLLARFEGGAVGEEEARPALAQLGAAAPASARRDVLEQVVRVKVLALAAEREGLHRSPEFLRSYQEELARLFLQQRFEEPFKKQLPQEAELKKFFEESRDRLGRPERVRLAHVALLAPASDAAARAAKRTDAERILAEVRRTARDEYAFGKAATLRSEDARSRPAAGELPFLTREELAGRLGPEVAELAFSLKPGEVAGRVVETAQGFQVVKLLAREEGREASYEEVREAIRARLTSDRRDKALKEFLDAQWQGARVEIDEKALETAAREPASPSPQ